MSSRKFTPYVPITITISGVLVVFELSFEQICYLFVWNLKNFRSIYFNFVIKLADRGVCGSVVEHRSAECEGLRFDSLWRLRIFSLSHARDKTKKHLFLFLYQAQNSPSPLFLSTRWDRFETLCSKTIEFGRNNKRRFLRVSVKNTKTWIIPCRRILHSHIR